MTELTPSDHDDLRSAVLLEQLIRIARISALEEMASGIAHELNQPIGAIATFAQAARRMLERPEPMVEAASEVLEHINQEALNAGQGIRRIRDLFNGQAKGRTECDLSEVIEELAPVLRLLSRRYGSDLRVSLQPELPKISIDRLRIQHVLFALVQNALEATAPGDREPVVRIDVTGDRYGVEVSVQDQGTGVPVEQRDDLFSPFFTTKTDGTGLGLASSRAIIEAHEGSIGFENPASGGARFWFRLPAVVQSVGNKQ